MKRLNMKKLIFAYILMYTVMPLVAIFTSSYLTTYSYMLVVVTAVMFTLFSCHLRDVNSFFLLLLPFILFELLTIVVAENENVLLSGYQVLLFMLPTCLGYYIMHNPIDYRLFSILLILIFGITAITTIVGCLSDPLAARTLATIESAQDPSAVKYFWMNIGGYSFVYSAVLLYPLAILAFKQKALHIAFVIPIAVILFALAVNTAYTVALMLMMLISFLFFLKRDVTLKRLIALMLGGVIFILVFNDFVTDVMQRIAELIGNEEMGVKMLSIFGDTDAVNSLDDNRGELYMKSFMTFLKNPVFGVFLTGSEMGIGGHSFILDTMARFGTIGIALLVGMYRSIFKIFFKPFAGKTGYTFVLCLFALPICLSAINTGMWLENLCLYSPLFLCRIYQKTGDSPLIEHRENFRRDAVKLIVSKEQGS